MDVRFFVCLSIMFAFSVAMGIADEVFHVKGYGYTPETAKSLCKVLNSTLATKAQLTQAFEDGASWCDWGWVQDGNDTKAYFPNTMDKVYPDTEGKFCAEVCGKFAAVVGPMMPSTVTYYGGLSGANCFGPKPARNMVPKDVKIVGFNRFLWSTSHRTNYNTRFTIY